MKINCAVKRVYLIFPQSIGFSFTHVLLRLLCRSYPRSATSTSFKMPKVKSKPSKKLIDLVNEYGSDISSTDNTVLFCKACGKSINHEKKYFVYQHLPKAKHKSATEKMKTEIANLSFRQNYAWHSFIDAGIPLWKLEKKSLRGFLEKYTKQHIPSESSLREKLY
ncbi:hypothetical protein T05_16097 [Trichinella murrelli]|uniref:CGG triplet repeat-binding protein 1 n=1 Tax=Trichinella murrelli TaxID=144512 RepID=A0A0V0T2T5_9BILA|nr:hypothetical protein T05_16097 [Trichinella murrelli]